MLACCCAVPIFGPTGNDAWDELRQIFYVRQFTTGEVYEHDASLDNPPFSTWARFYYDDKFYKHVTDKLDAFLKLGVDELERQPAIHRAVLLRDLWSVFDAQSHLRLPFDGENPQYRTASDAAKNRQAELRTRIAKVMRRLELSEDEARQLPDNLKAAAAAATFPAAFNVASADKGFIPVDLFDETGPWVAIGQGKKVPGASSHAGSGARSVFVPYIRVSPNRQDSLDFLAKYRKSPLTTPPGTQLALARRMALPASSGRIVTTPVLESLQLIVVAPPNDYRFKFVLDRAGLIAGRSGLRMLSATEPVDAFGFESAGLQLMKSKFDSDGEMLVLGQIAGQPTFTSMGHCAACHGPTVGARLFANGNGAHLRIAPTTWNEQAQLILSLQEKVESWRAYRKLRE
jgi:hypothetical protein